MGWIIGGAAAFIVLLGWSACAVGAKADRDLKEWLAEKRREG